MKTTKKSFLNLNDFSVLTAKAPGKDGRFCYEIYFL